MELQAEVERILEGETPSFRHARRDTVTLYSDLVGKCDKAIEEAELYKSKAESLQEVVDELIGEMVREQEEFQEAIRDKEHELERLTTLLENMGRPID